MTTDTAALHMVQLFLDPRRLVQLGKMMKLPLRSTDTNYLVHCALGELFGDDAPKPFFVDDDPRPVEETGDRDRFVRVLGYAEMPDEDLEAEARLCPNPTIHSMCDWDRFDSSDMPRRLAVDRCLEFHLRCCPIVRKGSAGQGKNAEGEVRTWREGQELDAFLSAAWEAGPDAEIDRESAYVDWLKHQFDVRGGAEIESAGVERFSIERMTRRTQSNGDGERTAKTIKRPDVTLRGVLRVTDAEEFNHLLRSGIGRHKSFGFGMLKIRRA
ncbi:type I-E CRISPR-associated protein Cas6/Cse3/CasE [Longibacter salinarum]|nr:type I-E CRISPR-associated protein Cas6/Cse3/CasE [Longibacter salinarum]